ncbi:glycoside hydrolase 15 protein [Entophlyctis luteolus]|nr:glycoside hydrolase 15 protein [Entophlyctis luteolus]
MAICEPGGLARFTNAVQADSEIPKTSKPGSSSSKLSSASIQSSSFLPAIPTTVQEIATAVTSEFFVKVDYYAYDGNFFSGVIWIQNSGSQQIVQVIYSDASGVWPDSQYINASYFSTNGYGYETWAFSAPLASIQQFYVKYHTSGHSYFDNNSSKNYSVFTPSLASETVIPGYSTTGTATTVHGTVPTPVSGLAVLVNNFEYNGITFSGTIWIKNIAFAKSVQVFYSTMDGVWSDSQNIAAKYSAANANGYETWTFVGWVVSIGQFYVKYQVSGATYYDNNNSNNYPVFTPNVSLPDPPPVCSGVTIPAVQTGFQDDITDYFSNGVPLFTKHMMANIHPSGTSPGIVVAAAMNSTSNNYFYHWVRDASLVMNTVNRLYVRENVHDIAYEQLFFDFQNITFKMQNENALTGLGEAKFNVDGSDFTGATAFMNFATQYLAVGGSFSAVQAMWNGTTGVILPDLNYVIARFSESNGCDLWEEQRGNFFWTFGAQRNALHKAAVFANLVGDSATAALMSDAAAKLDKYFDQFYNGSAVQEILNDRVFDSAVILGAIHNDVGDAVFGASDSRILASLFQFASGMINEYSINTAVTTNNAGLPLGVAVGRYFGDQYNGTTSGALGNPWYLCTAAVAEVAYGAAIAFTRAGCLIVDSNNIQLFNGAAPAGLGLNITVGTYQATTPEFAAIVAALETYGDKSIRRIQAHGAADFHLNEQFNRNTGAPQGVDDLTWSYSSLITAYLAREELRSL